MDWFETLCKINSPPISIGSIYCNRSYFVDINIYHTLISNIFRSLKGVRSSSSCIIILKSWILTVHKNFISIKINLLNIVCSNCNMLNSYTYRYGSHCDSRIKYLCNVDPHPTIWTSKSSVINYLNSNWITSNLRFD